MKRYWKLAGLGSLIVLSIGIFYGWGFGSRYPEYVLTLQKGDEKEAAPLILQGQYRTERLTIDSQGTRYLNERYLWERFNGNYFGYTKIEKLIKEHPNFMRGKIYPSAIYEDDQVLGYGNIKPQAITEKGQSDLRFDISVYGKLRKDTSSFETKVPKGDLYKQIYTFDVRVDGQTMKLFTVNVERKPEQEAKWEAHLYTLDLNKKNVVNDQVILSAVPPDENNKVNLVGVFTPNKSGYLVYQINHSKKNPGAQPAGINVSEAHAMETPELFVYNIENGKLEAIQSQEINDFLQNKGNLQISQTGENLFLASNGNKKESHVIKYSLAEKKVKTNLAIPLNELIWDTGNWSFNIENNRLYSLSNLWSNNQNNPTIAIVDLDTGGIVYEGTVSRKDGQGLSNLSTNILTFK